MLKWKALLGSLLVVAVVAGSALAGAKDSSGAKASAEKAAAAEPVSGAAANVSGTGGGANVTALLGVLVMKGVLQPAEANAIRNAAPDAAFQMLVETLTRKGVVSAEELAPVAVPVAKPVEPAQSAQTRSAPAKPAAPKVIPAVAPLRVLQLEPAKPEGMVPDLKLGSGARVKLYGLVKASVIYDCRRPTARICRCRGLLRHPGPRSILARRAARSFTQKRDLRAWERISNGRMSRAAAT